jgi:hypothetical protein
MDANEQLSSKTIKVLRESKFTEKRNPYKKYNKAKWNWTEIFKEIDLLKNDTSKILKATSKKYNINYKTLKNKYSHYKNNQDLFFDEENRGGSNKSFNEKEEKDIFVFLKENFIDKNKVLCNDIIKIHANDKFKKLYPDKKFNARNGWCNMFKKRWNLSTVKISISKVASTIYTEDEIKVFLNKCKDTLIRVGTNFFST